MSGPQIRPQQIQLYMNARDAGCSQQTAAAKAGFSERSARRLEQGTLQPQQAQPRHWRTRSDPLSAVWESELLPLLHQHPQLQPMTLFQYLQDHYPGQYPGSILRTLQRRVRQWKASHGPPQEVMFLQTHQPAHLGLSDFTQFKQMQITIAGEPLAYRLYHFRLAYSGWQYAQVVQGGESFLALAEGLQHALHRCGGSPREHRSDSLSAAYRNLSPAAAEDVTQRYHHLCQHYHMHPSRNNRGRAHENGAIESSHGHLKHRLHQSLLLRGSSDFDSVCAYQAWIEQVVAGLNHSCQEKFQLEQQALQPLPPYLYPDYEVLTVKVTRMSTITVRCILYSVPSRLIGYRLTLHLYHDKLLGFVEAEQVVCLPRIYAPKHSRLRRARCVNYRHVIDSLRRKPRAFLHCQWQQDLLPTPTYRELWRQLQAQLPPSQACRLMVESLYIAAHQDKEEAVARYLHHHLQAKTLTLARLQQDFSVPHQAPVPQQVQQHPLSDYDHLLSCEATLYAQRQSSPPVEVLETSPHAPPLAAG